MSNDKVCGHSCECKCESDCPFISSANNGQNKGYIKVINGYTYHLNDDIIKEMLRLYILSNNKNKKSHENI